MAEYLDETQKESLRQSEEYKVALSLGQWKEEQQLKFQQHLKKKELQVINLLESEWKRREHQRELIVEKKVEEYMVMVEQLKKGFAEVEGRESSLKQAEHQVARLRKELRLEHDRKLADLRDASQRMQRDFSHNDHLNSQKLVECEQQLAKKDRQLAQMEQRFADLQAKFVDQQSKLLNHDVVQFKENIALLTMEKKDLERQLEVQSKSKDHYKTLSQKLSDKVQRLTDKQRKNDLQEISKQREELKSLRFRQFADNEQATIEDEIKQLSDIKFQLSSMKIDPKVSSSVSNISVDSSQPLKSNPESNELLNRLITERDSLLQTGVYTQQDYIIEELEKRILEFS